MKVWVVTSDSYDGAGGSTVAVVMVCANETKAKDFCVSQNAGRGSSYSTTYEYDVFEVTE